MWPRPSEAPSLAFQHSSQALLGLSSQKGLEPPGSKVSIAILVSTQIRAFAAEQKQINFP